MHILFLSYWYPYPSDNGSKMRVRGLLRGLAQNHEVTFLSFVDEPQINTISPDVRSQFHDVRLVPRRNYRPSRLSAQFGLFSPTPRYIIDTFSTEFADCIKEILVTQKIDLVIASQLGTARYRSYFRHLPAIFEEVELGVYHERFEAETFLPRRLRNRLTWAKHRRYVTGLLREFQACTVVSEQERHLLTLAAPDFHSVETIPNFIDLANYHDVSGVQRPNSLVFSGPFQYYANHEAMIWFLSEIYPLIQFQIPDVHLTITGDHANLPIPPARNVELTGRVEDVRPLVASAWVSVVPLQVGGGSRLKILEAMALGVPVVSTSKGAEGLDLINGQHVLIGDTAEKFADQVVRLLKDAQARQEIIKRASQRLKEKYDWGIVMPRFESLVQKIGMI